MYTADSLIKICLIDNDSVLTYPFQKQEYENIPILRHKSNEKWYALIFEMDGELCLNLKCPPDLIPVLKEQYPAIQPAWHMNKKHWCKILVNKLPREVLDKLIKISFDLTAPKKRSRQG